MDENLQHHDVFKTTTATSAEEKSQTRPIPHDDNYSQKKHASSPLASDGLNTHVPQEMLSASGEHPICDGKQELELTKTHSQVEADDYPKGFRLFMIMLAIVLSTFLFALDLTIVATAIPGSLINSIP